MAARSPMSRHAILHPVLHELDESVGYGLAHRRRCESLCGDAALHARRVLCELLRPRSAGLSQGVLGRQSSAPDVGEGGIRSAEPFPPCPERAPAASDAGLTPGIARVAIP